MSAFIDVFGHAPVGAENIDDGRTDQEKPC